MNEEIRLSIVLQQPPAGVDFALQKGSGSNFETVQQQRSTSGDLNFEFTVTLKRNKDTAEPDFKGPFVQGPVHGRFVYIGIGTFAGRADSAWSRRLKIPLLGITSGMVEQLLIANASRLETHVRGTGGDGTPACGTAKPFAGWKIVPGK